MSLITFVLRGGIPELIKAKEKNRRQQLRVNSEKKLKAHISAKRRERMLNNPDAHERAKAQWRERRANQTPEERRAEYQRKKEIIASLSPEEYARRRRLATENQRRWRAKKKAQQQESKS